MNKEGIKNIILDQKEELVSLRERKRLIERICFNTYKSFLESNQIKVIIGPRRCGKSILASQLLQNKLFAYVNFDDEKLVNLSSDDLNDVLEVLYEVYGDFKYVLLDEIQNINGWELFVNRLQRKGFNIIVTGSNSHLLSKELSTHLTGRHIKLELFPFSFKEFITYDNIEVENIDSISTKNRAILKKKLNEYAELGGFPEVIEDPLNKTHYLQSLYSDIINNDIVIRHKIRYAKTLKDIATSLMSSISSQVSYTKIKNIFHLKSVHTALNYLSFLEESYLFFLMERFSFKSKERVIAPRKIYAIDTGMIDTLSVNFSQNIGKIYENIVFLELMRRKKEEKYDLFYWQNVNKNEVDFVIKCGKEAKELIQVCYDISNFDTKKREIKALINASKELKCKNLLIITYDYSGEEKVKGKMITYIPLWKWLLK